MLLLGRKICLSLSLAFPFVFHGQTTSTASPLRDLVVPHQAATKVFDSVDFSGRGKAIRRKFTYQLQSVKPHQKGVLATFARSDGDEPEYFYITDNEVFDQTIGYKLLRNPIQKGDEWTEVDPRNASEIARVKVVEAHGSVIVNKKKYDNCVSLLITLRAQNRTELRVFSPGVGLIQFKAFEGLEGYISNNVKCTESLRAMK